MKLRMSFALFVILLLMLTSALLFNIISSKPVYAEDHPAPTLYDVWVEPAVINHGESVTIYINLSDPLPHPDFLFATLTGPAGCLTEWLDVEYSASSSGLYEIVTPNFPFYYGDGEWVVSHIWDNFYDLVDYGNGIDYDASFIVVAPPPPFDVWVEPCAANPGENVTVYLDLSEFEIPMRGGCYISSPSGNQDYYWFEYNSSSGLQESTFMIPEDAESGLWAISQVDFGNDLDSIIFYGPPRYFFFYYGTDYTADFTVNSGTIPESDVWASDSLGNVKNSFVACTTVYATAPESGVSVSLYVVPADEALNDGDSLIDISLDGVESLTLNCGYGTQTIQVWAPPTILGNYYIVMDTNNNGLFDAETDCFDGFEIVRLSVIPEVPFGTIMIVAAMGLALFGYITIKKPRKNQAK